MAFKKKKTSFIIALLFLLTVFVGMQSTGAAAGEPPVARAVVLDGTYECDSILFDASGSSDPEGAALQYRWNFDGNWTEWSSTPYGEYMWLDDYTGAVMLEVSDGNLISTAVVDVIVLNVPPLILSIDGPASSVEAGTPMTITVHCFDGDPRNGVASLDMYNAMFSWGDSTSTTYPLAAGADVVIGSHVYTKAGNYAITISFTDDDGGTSQDSILVVVTGPPLSIDILRGIISDMNIPLGLQNSLLSKLGTIDSSHMSPNGKTEINKLESFINSVEAQRGKKLSSVQADTLIQTAESLIESMKKM